MGSFSSKTTTSAPPPSGGGISDVDRAMLDLKNARDRLQRYRNKLEQDDVKLLAQAKKAKDAGRKEKALGILRLRKYKQTQAASCEEQLLNVMQMVETIDSKQNEQQVLQAMAAGKDSLKKMHEETTVDDVLDLMDSIKEEVEVEQEITSILQGVPELSPADEEAVEAELAALQAEMDAEATTTTTTTLPELPTVPSTKLPKLPDPVVNQQEAQPVERIAVPG
mmetsp:Transcript_23045/g.48057  ORF Transcript_23045/g.48057 Transcript_23045/m.48057 type:complete len:223 (-) Transcript_23045:299-967(-)|eukprot:CAMPEP_0172451138 /NCGR_PEP_ID=MMETSP1065-20121228/9283_1 /TAXON_ID=265537 /ORGANISM="Amphiprora paludosa, Strain CCMP125" /LENGTH=222 /DNA_ID=CAMNT_0013203047 /DNA_START=133 /DNA_END=801 /DNA_ORIENTATION=-